MAGGAGGQRVIHFTTGNILEADVEALVNPVNCVGVMGAGLAAQFKRAFPGMFDGYATVCGAKELRPGRLHIHVRGDAANPRWIFNFPTKRHWRDKSRIADIGTGLNALVNAVNRRGIQSIAIPPLGCGLGGLPWEEVRPLIERAAERMEGVEVWVYEPEA